MISVADIDHIAKTLVSLVYPELQEREIVLSCGRTSCYGQVSWRDEDNKISISLNESVRMWHPAGITGLLSHELSHPSQKGSGFKEWKTDEDVIMRGLGPYLAIERLQTGKYDDHVIQNGKDRYFGYRMIRKALTPIETENLDILMFQLALKPSQVNQHAWFSHDVVIHEREGVSSVVVEGEHFILPKGLVEPDIKTVNRNGIVFVYAEETLIGQYTESDI
ncbi:MAG: hypothetical protein ACFFF9_15465 [Candidatus Thorarchaeota archaeon]